jgi:hypothetical protein
VTELALGLAGELPHCEYRDAAQQHGTPVRRRAGTFTHRRPGSIHGLEPGDGTPVGYTGLMIREGSGNWLGEAGFAEETVDVPFAPGWAPAAAPVAEPRPEPGSGVIVDWPDLCILDTEAMAWQPAGRYGLQKVLVRDGEDRPLLKLQHVVGDFSSPTAPAMHSHDHHQHDFIVWGEFPTAEYERPSRRQQLITLKAGHFIHRRSGAIHGLVPGGTSPTGCVTLEWYTDAAGRLVHGSGSTVDET